MSNASKPRKDAGRILRGALWVLLLSVLLAPSPANAAIKAWPLLYHSVDKKAGTEHLEICWPLVDIRTDTDRDAWRLLHLLSVRHDPHSDARRTALLFQMLGYAGMGPERWRAWVFPFFWWGREQKNFHHLVLPFYARIKRNADSLFALFPFYYADDKHFGDDGRDKTRGYLFLVWRGERTWNDRDKNRYRKKQFCLFPFYWRRGEYKNDRPTWERDALFPVFYASRWHWLDGQNRTETRGWRRGAFFLVWKKKQTVMKNGSEQSADHSFRVWPILSHRDSRKRDEQKKLRTSRARDGAVLLFKHTSLRREEDNGAVRRDRSSWRLFPLYFRGHDQGTERKKATAHQVVFPVFWDLRNGGEHVTAIVPLGARLTDQNYRAINILGPLLTYMNQKQKDYKRVDLLYPVFMVKKGRAVRALRVWPFYSREYEYNKRCTVSVLWPIFRHEESATRADSRRSITMLDIFRNAAAFCTGIGKARRGPSGGVSVALFPFYSSGRTADRRETTVFPLFQTRARSENWNGSEARLKIGPWGLLAAHSKRTEPDYHHLTLLGGAYGRGLGETARSLRLAYLLYHHRRNSTPFSTSNTTGESSHMYLLAGLYSRRSSETRSLGTGAVVSASSRQGTPILWQRRTTTRLEGDKHLTTGSDCYALTVPLADWSFYHSRHGRNGASKRKLMGGMLFRSREDVCGFSETSLLYRLFRRTSNSRGSSWECMPLAYGGRNEYGGWNFGILGGLLEFSRSRERSTGKFLYLPVYSRNHPGTKLTTAEIRTLAAGHLKFGKQYLAGNQPRLAAFELLLAQPAFSKDPHLYEALGDAYARTRGNTGDARALCEAVRKFSRSFSLYPIATATDFLRETDNRKILEQEAAAAYAKAREYGGDSVLLRRKELHLLQPARSLGSKAFPYRDRDLLFRLSPRQRRKPAAETKIDKAFAAAKRDFPEDFSLWVDYACWRWHVTGNNDVFADLHKRFPAAKIAANLRFTARLRSTAADGPEAGELFSQAFAACRLPGHGPAYIPIRPPEEPTPDDAGELRQATATLGIKLAKVLGSSRKKKYEQAGAVLERVLELCRGPEAIYPSQWQRRDILRTGRDIWAARGAVAEWVRILESHVAGIELPAARLAWQRDLEHLERELSYLRDWTVVCTARRNTPLDIHNPFARPYIDLRTALPTPTAKPKPVDAVCTAVIDAKAAGSGFLLLGFDEEITVEWNGETLFQGRCVIATPDEYAVPVTWEKGKNSLVIRLRNRRLAWGFYARLADNRGNFVPGLKNEVRNDERKDAKAQRR